jgi:hypothetical protein
MFEIDDRERRALVLGRLGGIEKLCLHRSLWQQDRRRARDPTRENTNLEGKASAVQFICFPFTREQIAAVKAPGARILAGFDHPGYGHLAQLPERVRAALAEDFD